MFVRSCRRLVALTFILSLCLVPVSAHAAYKASDGSGNGSATVSPGDLLGMCGDPDRGVGSPPLQKADGTLGADVDQGGTGWWTTVARWFTGLLQRGFRF